MSRVGRKVIAVPAGVKVSVSETALEVQGPKGKLTTPVPPGIKFALQGQELSCQRASDERQLRAFHGLARALAQNAIKGVTEGFSQGPRHRGRGLPRRRSRATRWCSPSATRTRSSSRSPRGSRSRSRSRRG